MANQRIPALRLHRPSGLAVVTLSGKDHYCGPFGSVDAKAKYDSLLSRWLANGRRPLVETKVYCLSDLFRDYLADVGPHFARQPRAQTNRILSEVATIHGSLPIEEFSPKMLRGFRDAWHERGLTKKSIQMYLSIVRQPFRWGIDKDLVSHELVLKLRTVQITERGIGSGKPSRVVQPVSEEHFFPVLERLDPMRRALLTLLWHTGARIGEWRKFDWPMLIREGDVWLYSPKEHKTKIKGFNRFIFVGPRAQAALLRYQCQNSDPFPFQEKNNGINSMIWKRCDRLGIPRWHPHQIRHSAASRIRAKFGVEAARTVLGHSVGNPITSLYAERDLELAKKVMLEMG